MCQTIQAKKEELELYSFKEHYGTICGKKLRVLLIDGKELIGDYDGIYSGIEEDSDYCTLELDVGEKGIIVGLTEDKIKDIEVEEKRDTPWVD